MRIIAGDYKGRKLKEFNNPSTRPTLDRVKESIFSKIHFNCADATVLDLFCGTGALGIEALSRGAENCYFVDNNTESINITKENLKNIAKTYKIMNFDYKKALNIFKNDGIKFDIILLDPPFNSNFASSAIKIIEEYELLKDTGIIIWECLIGTIPEQFNKLKLECSKKYGTVLVHYFINNY